MTLLGPPFPQAVLWVCRAVPRVEAAVGAIACNMLRLVALEAAAFLLESSLAIIWPVVPRTTGDIGQYPRTRPIVSVGAVSLTALGVEAASYGPSTLGEN